MPDAALNKRQAAARKRSLAGTRKVVAEIMLQSIGAAPDRVLAIDDASWQRALETDELGEGGDGSGFKGHVGIPGQQGGGAHQGTMSLEDAYNFYTASATLNSILRARSEGEGGKKVDPDHVAWANDVAASLDKGMKPAAEDVTVYRAVRGMGTREGVEAVYGTSNPKPGHEFVDNGFTSTTVNFDAAFYHGGGRKGATDYWILDIPKGTPILDLRGKGRWGAEGEILLPRRTKFVFTGTEYDEKRDIVYRRVRVIAHGVVTGEGGAGSGHWGHSGGTEPSPGGSSPPGQGLGIGTEAAERLADKILSVQDADGNTYTITSVTRKKVVEALASFPPAFVPYLKSIVVAKDGDDFRAMGKRDGSKGILEDRNVLGYAKGIVKTDIVIKNFFSVRTLVHELGHAITNAAKWYGDVGHWALEYKENPTFDRFSKYSRKNWNEGFCETYVSYVSSGGYSVSNQFRSAYNAISQVIGSVK